MFPRVKGVHKNPIEEKEEKEQNRLITLLLWPEAIISEFASVGKKGKSQTQADPLVTSSCLEFFCKISFFLMHKKETMSRLSVSIKIRSEKKIRYLGGI